MAYIPTNGPRHHLFFSWEADPISIWHRLWISTRANVSRRWLLLLALLLQHIVGLWSARNRFGIRDVPWIPLCFPCRNTDRFSFQKILIQQAGGTYRSTKAKGKKCSSHDSEDSECLRLPLLLSMYDLDIRYSTMNALYRSLRGGFLSLLRLQESKKLSSR